MTNNKNEQVSAIDYKAELERAWKGFYEGIAMLWEQATPEQRLRETKRIKEWEKKMKEKYNV